MKLLRTDLTALLLVGALAGCAGSSSDSRSSGSSDGTGSQSATTDSKTKVDSSKPKPFTVTEQGWTSLRDGNTTYVHWAARLHNPNVDQYGAYPKLSIVVKDKAGKLLAADEQVIDALPPGTDVAFSGQSDATGVPATVKVSYKDVDWYDTKTRPADYPTFKVTSLNVTHDQYQGFKVLGQVHNPYPKSIKDFQATALFYSKAGKLVGGATSFLSNMPSGGTAPVQVEELGADVPRAKVDHVKVHVSPWSGDPQVWNDLAAGRS